MERKECIRGWRDPRDVYKSTPSTLKVTGYQLREALRRWRDRRDIYARTFDDTLWQFKDDAAGNPIEIAQQYEAADRAIAELEAAQQKYNQRVKVRLPDGDCKLAVAVKRVGGAGRLTKMWRNAATSSGRDRYSYRDNRRSKDEEFAQRMVPQEVAIQKADEAALYASQLRAAIAIANNTEVELENIDPNLLK